MAKGKVLDRTRINQVNQVVQVLTEAVKTEKEEIEALRKEVASLRAAQQGFAPPLSTGINPPYPGHQYTNRGYPHTGYHRGNQQPPRRPLDLQTITCYNCQERGNFRTNCPQPQQHHNHLATQKNKIKNYDNTTKPLPSASTILQSPIRYFRCPD